MKPAHEPGQTVQRVKVGVTGLALVLLLIGVASAIFRSVDRSAAPMNGASVAFAERSSAGNAADPSSEPLAEIGVAPAGRNESTAAGSTGRRR